MLLGGDEIGRTQGGNNNAYCQDNEIAWLDWDGHRRATTERLLEFVARADRAAPGASGAAPHALPARPRASRDGVKDITWLQPDGTEMTAEQWQDELARCIGVMLNGQRRRLSHARRAAEPTTTCC